MRVLQAWSAIVHSLIPNVKRLEDELRLFCDMCDADEVVLFERATFLVISQSIRKVRLHVMIGLQHV